MEESHKTPLLTNRMYDLLKWFAQIVLPALGAAYFGLAQIWGFPNAEEIVGSIVVLDTFLGALLGLASKQYQESDQNVDGYLNFVDREAEDGSVRKLFDFALNDDPQTLEDQDVISFRVQRRKDVEDDS